MHKKPKNNRQFQLLKVLPDKVVYNTTQFNAKKPKNMPKMQLIKVLPDKMAQYKAKQA